MASFGCLFARINRINAPYEKDNIHIWMWMCRHQKNDRLFPMCPSITYVNIVGHVHQDIYENRIPMITHVYIMMRLNLSKTFHWHPQQFFTLMKETYGQVTCHSARLLDTNGLFLSHGCPLDINIIVLKLLIYFIKSTCLLGANDAILPFNLKETILYSFTLFVFVMRTLWYLAIEPKDSLWIIQEVMDWRT